MERTSRWWLTVVALPAAAMLTILLALPVMAGRLPGELATGWDDGGAAGSTPAAGLTAMVAFFWSIVWAGMAYTGRETTPGPEVLAAAYGVGVSLAAGIVLTVAANLDAAGWQMVEDPGTMPWAIVSGVAGAAAGWLLGGGLRRYGVTGG